MGKLLDIINKKNKLSMPRSTENVRVIVNEPQEESEEKYEKYTLQWLNDVALYSNFTINEDTDKVNKILLALERRNGQCPCGGNGEQFKCPCVIMREHHICKCGIFESIPEQRTFKGSTVSAKIDE